MVALAAVALFAAVAPALSQTAGGTTITDPLTDGKTVATRMSGGLLTAEGYKVTTDASRGPGQYLYYVLPAGSTGGTLTFEAMGFKFDKYPVNTETREHILGIFDADELHDPINKPVGIMLRFYDHKNTTGTFYAGSHRLRYSSPVLKRQCDRKAPVAWNATTWYRFKVEWSLTFVRWYKDGVLQCSVTLPNVTTPLPHVYVGSDYRNYYLTPPNVTYRNVEIVSK